MWRTRPQLWLLQATFHLSFVWLAAELSGSIPPGTVWLMSHQVTVEFTSDDFNSLSGFKAAYSSANKSLMSGKTSRLIVSHLNISWHLMSCPCLSSVQEKLSCSFEPGLCFWRQQQDDDGDWVRTSRATFPPFTGPSSDHTLGNSSGGSEPEILSCQLQDCVCLFGHLGLYIDARVGCVIASVWFKAVNKVTTKDNFEIKPLNDGFVSNSLYWLSDLYYSLTGFYIVTPMSPGQWQKSFRIYSLPLTLLQPMCLSFW